MYLCDKLRKYAPVSFPQNSFTRAPYCMSTAGVIDFLIVHGSVDGDVAILVENFLLPENQFT